MNELKTVICTSCCREFLWDSDVELKYCCDGIDCECEGRIITEVVCDECVADVMDNYKG